MTKSYEQAITADVLNELSQDISMWAEKKGFWNLPYALHVLMAQDGETLLCIQKLQKSQKNALITTEVAEHLEGIRKDSPGELPGFSSEEEEIADIIIRCLDYAGYYGLQIGQAVCAKMAKNEGRPYLHGKKF